MPHLHPKRAVKSLVGGEWLLTFVDCHRHSHGILALAPISSDWRRERNGCRANVFSFGFPEVSRVFDTYMSLYSADLTRPYCPVLDSRRIRSSGGPVIRKFGQDFEWSELHTESSALEPLRQVGDPEMDALLEELQPRPSDDVYSLIVSKAAEDSESAAARFLAEAGTVPEWVDWELIERGALTFVRLLPLCSVVLFNASLVGGFSAPKITKAKTPPSQHTPWLACSDTRRERSMPPSLGLRKSRSWTRAATSPPSSRGR